jgi:LSU ribosomal protein L9P
MQVILMQRVHNLGDLGDTVPVRPGYARNYLMPRGYALPATAANLKVFEERKAELMKRADASVAAARMRAGQLTGVKLTVRARVAEEGRLYGSVGVAEIAHAAEAAGVEIARSEIDMPNGAIHEIGSHIFHVRLHHDVTVELPVEVEEEKG